MTTNIIPAIMPEHFDDIESMVAMVRRDVAVVQLDLMDGKYVPEKTWPFFYGTDYDLEALKKEDLALPFWEEVNYELDLMMARPEDQLDTWLGIGASRVIFHYASIHDWQKIKDIEPGIRNFIKIGLAITVHDNLQDIYGLIEDGLFDMVQVMGIAQIGYQGEPFDPQSLEIISDLRARFPELLITVDGGVSLSTIADIARVGANQFVSGSAVFGNGMAQENITYLDQEIQNTIV